MSRPALLQNKRNDTVPNTITPAQYNARSRTLSPSGPARAYEKGTVTPTIAVTPHTIQIKRDISVPPFIAQAMLWMTSVKEWDRRATRLWSRYSEMIPRYGISVNAATAPMPSTTPTDLQFRFRAHTRHPATQTANSRAAFWNTHWTLSTDTTTAAVTRPGVADSVTFQISPAATSISNAPSP